MGRLSGVTADTQKGNHVREPIHKVIISANPCFRSKTDDPSLKMLEPLKDPPSRLLICTEALRRGGSNVKCSWLLHLLLMLGGNEGPPFTQPRDTRYK